MYYFDIQVNNHFGRLPLDLVPVLSKWVTPSTGSVLLDPTVQEGECWITGDNRRTTATNTVECRQVEVR